MIDMTPERKVYYDLVEANSIVPKLDFYFAELTRIQRNFNNICRRAMILGIEFGEVELIDLDDIDDPVAAYLARRLVELSEEYAEILDKIIAMGVVLEDADKGIVRIYSWMSGEEVFLSWQYGEEAIKFYHDMSEDYLCRRPIRAMPAKPPMATVLH